MIGNFPSKVNGKTKRIIGVSILAGGLWLSDVQSSYKSNKEILLLIYLTDPRLSSNEQLLKMVNDLRAGVLGS